MGDNHPSPLWLGVLVVVVQWARV